MATRRAFQGSAARSALFVPATAGDKHRKAFEAGADAVILDLEDSVSSAMKEEARGLLPDILAQAPKETETFVRINSPLGGWGRGDLDALSSLNPDALVVPKASPEAVELAAEQSTAPLLALVETAAGVLRAEEIAAHPAVARLILGPVDLAAELGCSSEPASALLSHCRARLVLVSAAAELAPPVDGPCLSLRDEQALAREIQQARDLGFAGKLCVHPAQVTAVNLGFTPGAEEIAWADAVVEGFEAADSIGVTTVGGEMVDLPVVERARKILATRHRASGVPR